MRPQGQCLLSLHGLLIGLHRDDRSCKLLAQAVQRVLQTGLPDRLQALLAAADARALVLVVAQACVGLACLHHTMRCLMFAYHPHAFRTLRHSMQMPCTGARSCSGMCWPRLSAPRKAMSYVCIAPTCIQDVENFNADAMHWCSW